MRMILIATALLVAAPIASSTVPPVMAQTGSGSQETKPGGSSGGHECEREKKEQATS